MGEFTVIREFPDYLINRKGDIISRRRKNPTVIVGKISNNGYRIVGLRDEIGKRHHVTVHRLVAITFLPNPDELPDVNHKDGNKLNNSVENLEWCSKSDNARHAIDILHHWPRLISMSVQTPSGEYYVFHRKTDCIKFVAEREGLSFDHARKLMSGQVSDVNGRLRGYRLKKVDL